jgi:trehalose 6-phosphate phosphatase
MTPPDLDRTTALFLDLDGTLIEIAATPDDVVVPSGLPTLLSALHALLGGALAIVTGRSLAMTDSLLKPFAAAAAGEHGVSLRRHDGTREDFQVDAAVPSGWRESLAAASERWPGLLVEAKPHGVAIHYRLVPDREEDVWRLARELVPDDHPTFRLIPARKAVEIGPRATSKGRAVERLMTHAPFRGRRPIFVGDDFTDEAGMEAARRLGGEGLRVAEVFGGQPVAVRAWLQRSVDIMGGRVTATGASSLSAAP